MPHALRDGAVVLIERLAALEPAAVCSGKTGRQIDVNSFDTQPPSRVSAHVGGDVGVHRIGVEMRLVQAERQARGKTPTNRGR